MHPILCQRAISVCCTLNQHNILAYDSRYCCRGGVGQLPLLETFWVMFACIITPSKIHMLFVGDFTSVVIFSMSFSFTLYRIWYVRFAYIMVRLNNCIVSCLWCFYISVQFLSEFSLLKLGTTIH